MTEAGFWGESQASLAADTRTAPIMKRPKTRYFQRALRLTMHYDVVQEAAESLRVSAFRNR